MPLVYVAPTDFAIVYTESCIRYTFEAFAKHLDCPKSNRSNEYAPQGEARGDARSDRHETQGEF